MELSDACRVAQEIEASKYDNWDWKGELSDLTGRVSTPDDLEALAKKIDRLAHTRDRPTEWRVIRIARMEIGYWQTISAGKPYELGEGHDWGVLVRDTRTQTIGWVYKLEQMESWPSRLSIVEAGKL